MNRIVFWAAFTLCAGWALLGNLGSTPFWQDEAETAVLARNVLRFGVPQTDDGTNLVSQNSGKDHDSRGVWNYSPWLGIYTAAASFALLGQSTFSGRLPFALFGFLTFLLLHRAAKRWSGNRRTADLSILLLLLCVPFLLHARQCRYYALSVFFALYFQLSCQEFLESEKKNALHLGLSAMGLFYSNFLVFFAVLGGVLSHFLLSTPGKIKFLRKQALPIGASFLLILPGCFYFNILPRAAGESPHFLLARWENFIACFHEADYYFLPLPLLLFLFHRRRWAELKAPLTFLFGGLIFLALAPHYFFRYLLAFAPLFCFLLAESLLEAYRLRKEAGIVSFLLLLSTRWLSPSTWISDKSAFKTDLFDFAYELTHPILEPIGPACDYLNSHASPKELILVSYPDLPFIFYTKLKVAGGGSGGHPIPLRDLRWILFRREMEKKGTPINFKQYERISLAAPNGPWGNRPDPDRHVFRTMEIALPAYLYHRLKNPEPTKKQGKTGPALAK